MSQARNREIARERLAEWCGRRRWCRKTRRPDAADQGVGWNGRIKAKKVRGGEVKSARGRVDPD